MNVIKVLELTRSNKEYWNDFSIKIILIGHCATTYYVVILGLAKCDWFLMFYQSDSEDYLANIMTWVTWQNKNRHKSIHNSRSGHKKLFFPSNQLNWLLRRPVVESDEVALGKDNQIPNLTLLINFLLVFDKINALRPKIIFPPSDLCFAEKLFVLAFSKFRFSPRTTLLYH